LPQYEGLVGVVGVEALVDENGADAEVEGAEGSPGDPAPSANTPPIVDGPPAE
jgi:hypothetical protein